MGDDRFICDECGVKWFVPEPQAAGVADPADCAACGGRLIPLATQNDDHRPGWQAPQAI